MQLLCKTAMLKKYERKLYQHKGRKNIRQDIHKIVTNEKTPAVNVGREWRIPLESIRFLTRTCNR